MSYYYVQSEPGLWTVGASDPGGNWHPHEDFDNKPEAAAEVAKLNGENHDAIVMLIKRLDALEAEVKALKAGKEIDAEVGKRYWISRRPEGGTEKIADEYVIVDIHEEKTFIKLGKPYSEVWVPIDQICDIQAIEENTE